MKEKIAAFLKHIYGYFTDQQNEGDFMKISGACLMIWSVVRFIAFGVFDPVAFGAGAGAFATSKAIDVALAKKVE